MLTGTTSPSVRSTRPDPSIEPAVKHSRISAWVIGGNAQKVQMISGLPRQADVIQRHAPAPKGTILLSMSCPMSARPNHGIPDLWHQ